MRTMHLFAGGGGGILADLILGHNPIVAIEHNAACCHVLRARLPWLHVIEGDIRDVDFGPWDGRVDCIAAGFPCQDVSVAGRGAGINGERSGLVWEVFRAIDAIRPAFVFLENSPAIRTKGRREVIAALVARGYSWRDGALAASDVGAPHERKRWWLLAANADGKQLCTRRRLIWWRQEPEDSRRAEASPDAMRNRLEIAVQRGGICQAEAEAIQAVAGYTSCHGWSPPDACTCGVADGMASRVDRMTMLGNGQVPLQAAVAWLLLTSV